MYEKYYQKVYNYVFYRVMNKEVAEDIVSEVFCKAFENRSRYDAEKSRVSTWIFTVSRNCIIDYYRKKKETIPLDLPVVDSIVYGEGIEDHIIREIDKEIAVRCLGYLKERERMVVYLRYFMDFSYREIAEHMSISEKNVSVILTRSVRKIKLMIDSESIGKEVS